MQKAAALLPSVHSLRPQLRAEMTRARIEATAGNAASVIATLESCAAQARQAGFVEMHLEARLALADAFARAGQRARAVSVLKQLERDAAEKDFELIASKAKRLLKVVSRPV
jgi:lipopolysaccharide biosynthesis regulator YciM